MTVLPALLCLSSVFTADSDIASQSRAAAWLVQLGRHHGHLVGRDDPQRVTLHVLGLMKAASEIDPSAAEAWLWQYDLYSRMGRIDEAREALSNYVRLDPRDESAALQHLALVLMSLQTAEARGAYLTDRLKQTNLPRSLQSDIHRRLAHYFRERGDNAEASRQIERALRLMPMNQAARELAYEMFSETEPLLQRVELALQLVRINPMQVNVLWELGQLLDAAGLHNEAQEWYQRALDVHRRATDDAIPAESWFDLAVSYAASGRDTDALSALQQALKDRPDDVPSKLLKVHVAQRAGRDNPDLLRTAEAELHALSDMYDAQYEKVQTERDYHRAADMAWFYAATQPDPRRALETAELAMSAPFPDSLTRRSYGFALLLNKRVEEAAEQLKQLADSDQMAALGMARALLALSRREEAIAALKQGVAQRHGGMAYDRLCEELRNLGETPPPAPSYPSVVEALERFDRRIFDFHKRPSDTLKLTLQFVDDPLPPVGPIRVRVRLENINPPDSFAVTMGDGLMVQPVVVLTARISGREKREFLHFSEVLLNRRPVLVPGDAVEQVVAVDVGRFRYELIRTCTFTEEIELNSLFDPIRTAQGYTAGLGSVSSLPIRATRTGLSVEPAALSALVQQAKSGSALERMEAAARLGGLIAARDLYPGTFPGADAMSAAGIDEALFKLTDDPEWSVRMAAVDAVSWGRPLVKTVAPRLAARVNDPHAAVRLMGVRLFAGLQRKQFQDALDALSRSDPSPAVRLVAESYVTRVQTSQPRPVATP